MEIILLDTSTLLAANDEESIIPHAPYPPEYRFEIFEMEFFVTLTPPVAPETRIPVTASPDAVLERSWMILPETETFEQAEPEDTAIPVG